MNSFEELGAASCDGLFMLRHGFPFFGRLVFQTVCVETHDDTPMSVSTASFRRRRMANATHFEPKWTSAGTR